MAKLIRAICNPELYKSARTFSRLPLNIAAEKLKVDTIKLENWENGRSRPTIGQVRKLSKLYRLPISFFFLPKAPEFHRPNLNDYRRLPGGEIPTISLELNNEIRSVLDRREIILDIMQSNNERPTQFTHEFNKTINPEELGEQLRRILQISNQVQETWQDPRVAFNHWRQSIESLGVLVFQTKTIEIHELRAFSINVFPMPIILINRKDSYAGRIFSLLHELTHLVLHSSGICDMKEDEIRPPEEQAIEIFCNHSAGACLIPSVNLQSNTIVRNKHSNPFYSEEELVGLAKQYSVSREVVLRRLLIMNFTTQGFYEQKRHQWIHEYRRITKSSGRPPVYIDVVSLLGKPFIQKIFSAYRKDQITTHDLSSFLNAKIKHFDLIESLVG